MRSATCDQIINALAADAGIEPEDVGPGEQDAIARLVAQAEAEGILVLPVGHTGAVVLVPDRRGC